MVSGPGNGGMSGQVNGCLPGCRAKRGRSQVGQRAGPAAADGGPRAPGRRVEQGCRDHGPLCPRGRRCPGLHADRRRAGRHPQPGHGPARDPGEHRRDPARGDGPGPGDPGRAAALPGLRRLRPARGRPAAAAAGGLLRAAARWTRPPSRWSGRSASSARM